MATQRKGMLPSRVQSSIAGEVLIQLDECLAAFVDAGGGICFFSSAVERSSSNAIQFRPAVWLIVSRPNAARSPRLKIGSRGTDQ